MSALALDYSYRYAFSSEVAATSRGTELRLATFGGAAEHPYFFTGKLTRPQRTADLLRGLVQIVQSRFHVPPAMLARILLLADPVITSGGDILRFEAFSACCSAYARVDLLPNAIDGELTEQGTTNVDFNAPLRAALARIRDDDAVELSVGAREFKLARSTEAVVEKKVALPLRWLKGFVEVQAYQARMRPCLEVSEKQRGRGPFLLTDGMLPRMLRACQDTRVALRDRTCIMRSTAPWLGCRYFKKTKTIALSSESWTKR